MDKIEEVKNYAAKWFDKGRDYGNASITKETLLELETEGERICQLFEPKLDISPYALPSQAYDEYFTPPDESRLLTFEEWLCEEEGNIPFHKLSKFIQVKVKAQYEHDKKHRLLKQDAQTASVKDAEFLEWLEQRGSKQQVELFKEGIE